MKKIMLAVGILFISVYSFAFSSGPVMTDSFNGPNVKGILEESFQNSFPNAEDVHWTEERSGYAVSFKVKDILTRISYDKKGKFVGSLRYYSEQVLPFYLINLLKQKYPGQKIYGVTEISDATGISYDIKLESDKYWTTVLVDNDGNSVVTERYHKQK